VCTDAAERGEKITGTCIVAGSSPAAEAETHNGIPDDFWRPVPCGHPADPVAAIASDGHAVCHCGSGLDPEQGLPDWKEFGAPGPIVECRKCGCYVAVAASGVSDTREGDTEREYEKASPVPAVADDPERCPKCGKAFGDPDGCTAEFGPSSRDTKEPGA
jgi:hypothetical protein